MGEIAEMMLDGTLCEGCGGYIDDDGAEGFPRYCSPACAEMRGAPWIEPGPGDGSGKRKRNRRKNKRRRQRMAAKNRARLAEFDTTGWTELSPTHFRRIIDGKKLDYWPSTGKFMFDGVVHKSGIDEFLKERENYDDRNRC